MKHIEIYSKSYCPYCALAKSILGKAGAPFTEIDVEHDHRAFAEMVERSGRKTVPQIFIDGQHIGGSDDLVVARDSGLLERLLNNYATAI